MTEQADAVRILQLLDLTLLDENAGTDQIRMLCERAVTPFGHVAAVCIPPGFVTLARTTLESSALRVATVANFPSGTGSSAAVAGEIESCVEAGAHEIDVVYPWGRHLRGQYHQCADMLAQWRHAARDRTLKVILETGALGEIGHIQSAADISLEAGADFLKTSTGKTRVSATPRAARAMLGRIQASGLTCGFKASGGINTMNDALSYLDLAKQTLGPEWLTPKRFRIGASRLLDDLLLTLATVE